MPRRRTDLLPTGRSVLGVVAAFTLGHSVTLIASALGWVHVPSRLVEVLVGVAAIHALRPLVPHGENAIAAGFGLVHGLAFAGILVDLGLSGSTSVLALLAFNVGVELAQLVAIALLFPSLYLLATPAGRGGERDCGAGGAQKRVGARPGSPTPPGPPQTRSRRGVCPVQRGGGRRPAGDTSARVALSCVSSRIRHAARASLAHGKRTRWDVGNRAEEERQS